MKSQKNIWKNKSTVWITQGGVIAGIYVILTWVFSAFSFGEIQVRLSEALTIMPVFTPAAVPGLFVGCLLGNLLGSAVAADTVFGSLATLIGAFLTRKLRNAHPAVALIPPILSNALIVPFVLRYAYGVPTPIWMMMLTVGLGEVLSCGVLGLLLYYSLNRHRNLFALSPSERTHGGRKENGRK